MPMADPRHRERRGRVPWPYRQILDRARHPTGWRSSMETRPNQSIGSFAFEVLLAGAAFVIIVLLMIQLG